MSMRERGIALLAALAAGCAAPGPPLASTPRLGVPVYAARTARADLTVFPDGRGLPPGRGTPVEGARLFDRHCAVCHGTGGRGAAAEELAGASEPLTSATPDKTVGSYWPYATTLFDFIRRAKPMGAPGSLSADEVYALSAYLLYANGVIGERDTLDAQSLPRVHMPNRDGFIGVDAPVPR